MNVKVRVADETAGNRWGIQVIADPEDGLHGSTLALRGITRDSMTVSRVILVGVPVGSGDLHNDASKLQRILHAGGGHEVTYVVEGFGVHEQTVDVRELREALTKTMGKLAASNSHDRDDFDLDVTLRPHAPDTVDELSARVTIYRGSESPPMRFDFADGSSRELRAESPRPARDVGRALLEPITPEEHAGVEPILGELWAAVDAGGLTTGQRHQILAMAELIKAQHLAAEPGETERWKLVGPIRAALKYLAKEAPRDALAWWKLIELLEKINWSTLAGELPL